MGLRPEDINEKNFSTNFHGYNIDEVNDFMDRIQKDYSHLLRNYKHVAKYASDAQNKLQYYRKREKTVSQSIIIARTAANKVLKNAKNEGEITKRNARKDAYKLTKQVQFKLEQRRRRENKRLNSIIVEANNLCNNTKAFRRHIRALLQGQLNFNNDSRWDKVFKQEAKVTNYKVANISQRYRVSLPSRMAHKVVIFYPNGDIKEV